MSAPTLGKPLLSTSQTRLPCKPFTEPRRPLINGHFRRAGKSLTAGVAAPEREGIDEDGLLVEIDNKSQRNATVLRLKGLQKPGLLAALTSALQTLDIDVEKVRVYTFSHIAFCKCSF